MAGYDKLLSYEEFEHMKIAQYQDILVSKDMACPECNGSSQFSYDYDRNMVEPTPIGWCETENGFMACFECPKCFTKYRFHISTTGRWEKDQFYRDYALLIYLHKHHQEKKKQ
ncbi:MAG: hypothetical protein IJT98_09625 [Prevotella sp.]|nr:hypothetical protein [Prevotella sp.]